ncbi:MAG TPA: SigE family RNA polymerase sigma factor [Acidimicrobiales bacterium]|nr:SigE family RNA polymerase sigma factor [Acidimicrobiales bacterium]
MPEVRRDQRRAAFEQFVAGTTDSLLRTAYLVTGDTGLAEDLVQESLFRVARRWSRVVSMDSPEAYARRILVNLALDGSERRSRHRAELEVQSHPGGPPRWEAEIPWAGFSVVEARIELIRALGELTARQRTALVLRYFDDLSEAEVASALRCSVGTVKSTTARALEKMRALVEQQKSADSTGYRVLACPERKGERR